MWMYFSVERVLGNSIFPEFAYMVPLSSAVVSEVTIIRPAAFSLTNLLSVQARNVIDEIARSFHELSTFRLQPYSEVLQSAAIL